MMRGRPWLDWPSTSARQSDAPGSRERSRMGQAPDAGHAGKCRETDAGSTRSGVTDQAGHWAGSGQPGRSWAGMSGKRASPGASTGHSPGGAWVGWIADAALAEAVAGVWRARADRYSEIRSEATTDRPRIEMSYIGG